MVASFASIGSEIDTSLLNKALFEEGRLAFPRITSSSSLSMIPITSKKILDEWQVLQVGEIEGEKVLKEDEIALCLVPFLAIDLQGRRLGYGQGHYDRFLKGFPIKKAIGIGFQCQLVPQVPQGYFDIPLERIELF